MVNRLKGRLRQKQNDQGFLSLGATGTQEYVVASKAGTKWRKWEDAVIIAAGSEDSVELDAQLAAQLGRTPSAVRARRAKLKKAGKI